MGFRSVRDAQETASWSTSGSHDHEEASSHRGGQQTAHEHEERFGIELYQDGLSIEVQRLAQQHGADQVQRWADEGMTVETMGKPRDMDAFRERQQNRPAAIPTDIERRNVKSVQRSRDAHLGPAKAGNGQVPDSVRDVIASSGQQLDSNIQQAMEERMGDNLGDVRIHTGAQAANACEDINARAFTVGNHVAFNRGEYDPGSAEGQHVLAHELAHVRQQTGGAVSLLPQDGELAIDPDEHLEREADETAQRVMGGGELGIYRMQTGDIHVQRLPRWSNLPNREELEHPISALEQMGVDEALLDAFREVVDEEDREAFLSDVTKIGGSRKDIGGDVGHVGEVLSSHPEKNLVESFVEDFDQREEVVVVPGPENMVKGFQVNSRLAPEFDKVVMNKATGEVLKVVEEKSGASSDDVASEAVSQAEKNLDAIANAGIPRDADGNPQIEKSGRLSTHAIELSKGDFENAEPCAIVPRGQNDCKDSATAAQTYLWDSAELKLMYQIARDVREW